MKVKKNIALDDVVIARVSEYAKDNGISFAGAISVLVGQALQAQKGVDSLTELVKTMDQLKKALPQEELSPPQ